MLDSPQGFMSSFFFDGRESKFLLSLNALRGVQMQLIRQVSLCSYFIIHQPNTTNSSRQFVGDTAHFKCTPEYCIETSSYLQAAHLLKWGYIIENIDHL